MAADNTKYGRYTSWHLDATLCDLRTNEKSLRSEHRRTTIMTLVIKKVEFSLLIQSTEINIFAVPCKFDCSSKIDNIRVPLTVSTDNRDHGKCAKKTCKYWSCGRMVISWEDTVWGSSTTHPGPWLSSPHPSHLSYNSGQLRPSQANPHLQVLTLK